MRYSQLPESDCHYSLRSNILQSIGSQQEQYNFSVAYDWQFKGFTGKMIRQMNEFTLKINIDNRNHGRDNLALHESTIIRCARSIMNNFKNTGNITDRNLTHLYGIFEGSKIGADPNGNGCRMATRQEWMRVVPKQFMWGRWTPFIKEAGQWIGHSMAQRQEKSRWMATM